MLLDDLRLSLPVKDSPLLLLGRRAMIERQALGKYVCTKVAYSLQFNETDKMVLYFV